MGWKNRKITTQAAVADEEVTAMLLAEMKKLIKENRHHPKQVFNYDETVIFWKKMPYRNYIHKNAKEAPRYKI